MLFSALIILTFIVFNEAVGLQCYECSFGLELDLTKFPQVFGQDRFSFSTSKPSVNMDKWCGIKNPPQNSSVAHCNSGCVLVRSTDDLTRMAGCANDQSTDKIITGYSIANLNASTYEMFICSHDKCNESPDHARQIHAKSSSSGAIIPSTIFLISVLLTTNQV